MRAIATKPAKTYLVVSTVLALFPEAANYRYGIDIKLFYFVMCFNLLLLILWWDWRLDRGMSFALAYVWLLGMASVLAGTNRAGIFLEQAVGISLTVFYFYLFFKYAGWDVEDLFDFYATVAYYVALIGLARSAVLTIDTGEFAPVRSVMQEPAHFATVVLPAAYYQVARVLRGRGSPTKAVVTGLAVLLSGSAIALIGAMIAFLLAARGRWRNVLITAPLVACLGVLVYHTNEHFRVRMDDSLHVLKTHNVREANLSTYALLSNGYASISALKQHPLFGFGIGAHQLAHRAYIGHTPGSRYWGKYINWNDTDASSMLLRAASELGMVGLCLIGWFLYRCHVGGSSLEADISAACITYFALKLLREGHWFPPEMYFFVWTYVLVWRKTRQEGEISEAPAVAPAYSFS